MSIPDLPTLRVQYADARAALRRSTDVFEMTKAACADNIVVRANGDLGKKRRRPQARRAGGAHPRPRLPPGAGCAPRCRAAGRASTGANRRAERPTAAKRTPYP